VNEPSEDYMVQEWKKSSSDDLPNYIVGYRDGFAAGQASRTPLVWQGEKDRTSVITNVGHKTAIYLLEELRGWLRVDNTSYIYGRWAGPIPEPEEPR